MIEIDGEYKDEFGRHVITFKQRPINTSKGTGTFPEMILYKNTDGQQEGLYVMLESEFNRQYTRQK